MATSIIELLIGVAVVLGHNVWHILPNEVPILFVLALASFCLRDGNWKRLGFTRPASWRKTILWALAIAVVRLAIGELFPDPATSPKGSEQIPGHPGTALAALAFIWIFAAFGEEIAYRAYLTRRAAEVTRSWWAAAVITSVLFGFGHSYKGPGGMIDSGIAGLLLASAYILSGKNLWVCVLAHGFIDTTGLVVFYFGWSS